MVARMVSVSLGAAAFGCMIWQGAFEDCPAGAQTAAAPGNRASQPIPPAPGARDARGLREKLQWREAPAAEVSSSRVRLPGGGTLEEAIAKVDEPSAALPSSDRPPVAEERQAPLIAGQDVFIPLAYRAIVRRYFEHGRQ